MSSNGLFLNSSVFLAGPARRERFALVDTASLEDKNLSWKAKGIWAILLSRTDNWQTRVTWLSNLGPDGVKSVRSGLRELEANGYVLSRRPQAADGTFLAYEYLVLGAPASVIFADDFVERWKNFSEPPSQENTGIIRTPPHLQRRFTQIDAGGLIDPDIDFRAKGIWCYLMSRPEGWTVQMNELASASTDGRKSTVAGINQLLRVEYILRKHGRLDNGRFEKSVYFFFDKRFSEIKSTHELLTNELAEFGLSQPLAPKGSTVNDQPLAPKGSTVNDQPLAPKGSTAAEIDNPVIKQTVSPQTPLRQVDKRQVLSAPILRTKETYKEDYLGGRLVSREEAEKPTNQPTNPSIEEFLESAFFLPTPQFIYACSDFFKLGWSEHIGDAFIESFSNYDSKTARLWLVYEKFERLAGKFSAYGIYDMLRKDLDVGKCPRPSFPPRIYEDSKQYEIQQEKEVFVPDELPQLTITSESVSVWSKVQAALSERVSTKNFELWIKPLTIVGVDTNENFYLSTKDEFTKVWIEDNYLTMITAEFQTHTTETNVSLIVQPHFRPETNESR